MSASKEKKKRLEDKSEGVADKRAIQAKEEAEKKKKFRIRAIIAGVIVVLVILFVIVINTDFIYTSLTAVTIDGQRYTIADFNYWYGNAYMNFYEDNYDYLQYGYYFNTGKSLRNQYVDEEKTLSWADYFEQTALNSMKNVQGLCNAADEAGFTLTDEQKASIRSSLYSIDFEGMGYSSLKNYLSTLYGKGVSEKVYLKNMERMYLAGLYSSEILNTYDFTDEELTAYYDEHRDDYDRYTYNMYYVAAEKKDGEEKASEEAMAAAKAIADDLVAATSLEDFSTRILKYCSESETEKYSDISEFQYSYTISGLSSTFKDWLISDEAVPDATTIIDMENGYYVLYFVEQGGNDYNVVNYRQIVFNISTDSTTGLITEETLNNATTAAQGVYNMWQRNPTEEEFTELASSYSADSTTSSNGGLCENVAKDQAEEAVEEWLFDPERKEGDVSEPIRTSSSFYIIYYQGQGDQYWRVVARSGLESETYSNWISELVENMDSDAGWLLKFADYRARV